MAQQTAVEWLIDKVEDHFCLLPVDLIEQAEQMEKEQMLSLIRFMRINDKMGKSVEHLYNEYIKTNGK